MSHLGTQPRALTVQWRIQDLRNWGKGGAKPIARNIIP